MDQPVKVNGQKAMGFIFATLLIDVMGLAIIIPVIPGLIETLIHGDVSTATRYSGWLTGCYAIMQFIFSPIIGNLSDRYGRRPVLLCSLLGFSVDYFFSAFAPTIGWLFIGRIVAGITGASFTTASAYISDVSTPEKKAANFGLIGVAFGLGFIFGPLIGGFLGKYNIHYPFIAAGALALVNTVYGYFALPESLDEAHRRKFEWKRANPIGTLKQLTKYKSVMGLAISLFLIYFAAQAVQSVWTFYTIKKFNWNTDWQGYSLGMVGFLTAVVQGGLIRITLPKLGHERSIWMGLLMYSLGLFLFAFAGKGWMMFVFLIPYCLGGIAGPALQGYMSNNVPPNAQGELQGGLVGLMSLSNIFGPLTMTNVFYRFTEKNAPIQFPGAPFIIGALLMLASALLAVRNFKKSMTDKADAKDNGSDIAIVSH